MSADAPLRIANCSGFFGDRLAAAAELVADTELDVLTGDWLAELTMSILRRQRERDPSRGWASTFLRQMEQVLGACVERGIQVVTNAGGLNPEGCAAQIAQLADRLGLGVRVGYVTGDDLLPRAADLVAAGRLRPFGSASIAVDELLAANAYLGAWSIAQCLDDGAQIVVTGRVTDASLVVGPAAHAFGWKRDDWNALAGAVVAGHVIECGAQATGGNFAFFDEVPGLARVGFPVAELAADGSAVITKAGAPGGTVTTETVTAQLLYEIQGARYLNPDVTVDLTTVALSEAGRDRVAVRGTRGSPPPPDLKVSCVLRGGYRNAMMLGITGAQAEQKASIAEAAIWEQIPGGRAAFDEVDVALVGRAVDDAATHAEATTLLRIAVKGRDERAVGRGFSDAVVATGLASYPGFFMTTPPTQAAGFDRYRPALVNAADVVGTATVGDHRVEVPATATLLGIVEPVPISVGSHDASPSPAGSTSRVRLGRLVGARSGDKGGDANLGLWVRDPAAYPWLAASLTVERLRDLLPEAAGMPISRTLLPNLSAVNFVISGFLGEGVSSCLRVDGQAKGLGEFVRSRYVEVPDRLLG